MFSKSLGLGMLYFDLDGVLRDLEKEVLGVNSTEWVKEVQGMSFCNYVSKNLDLLVKAPPTSFFSSILDFYAEQGIELKILACQPKEWRPKSDIWLDEHLMHIPRKVIYVDYPKDKGVFIKDGDYLIDDMPRGINMNKVILLDRPYNRKFIPQLMRISTPYQMRLFLEFYYLRLPLVRTVALKKKIVDFFSQIEKRSNYGRTTTSRISSKNVQ